MYYSCIGGGGFALVKASNGSFEFINYCEKAPAAAFENMSGDKTNAATNGGLASGVPGDLRGLEYLQTKYGFLPWSTVFQPSIKLAREGFPVTEDLVHYMASAVEGNGYFLCNDLNSALELCANGTRLGLGDTMTRKRYAVTLETIANKGADTFYSGPIAESTIKAVQATNGTMAL